MKRQHAEKNEKLCRKLYGEGEFLDWVITTAFYSAIHYIDEKLFPVLYLPPSVEFKNVEEAQNYLRSRSRHQAREQLVKVSFPEICADYIYLEKACHNSRYKNFKVNEKEAELAIEALDRIKAYLQKK